MPYRNLKLISMRLPEKIVNTIDEYAAKRRYMSRTQVVSNILLNVLECSDEFTLHKMIETWDAYSSGYTVHFTSNK